jgi:hypothetical protein
MAADGGAPNVDVATFLDGITPARRQRDARTMVDVMGRVTGRPAHLWGRIVGFGAYHYRYASGREGDAPAAGFAPRKAALVVYLSDGVGAHADLLARLGPHTTGVSCVYLKDLGQNNLPILEQIVARSYATLTAGTYEGRARDSESP